ncbi:hypothetical protein PQU94_09110 [Asticcacaulis sp. DXS10W]|uniref:DUF2059 domain-containing protein n=1 Tax=Asticcacaulis currens TaxID=2984210 RepID=A0ABT5IER5_9CAUL|nr:hypothetical protein [Asticcacaulis currens]MDC7694438.1 hypothetical protein [Asticcacaulis currens]
MALFRSLLLFIAIALFPEHALAANSANSEHQRSDHEIRVKRLVAVNGLHQANVMMAQRLRESLLEDVLADAGGSLTAAQRERFEAIVSPICQRLVMRLDDRAVHDMAPRLNSADVEELIGINTSPLGARFVSDMASNQAFDLKKFDNYVQKTAQNIVSAMKAGTSYSFANGTVFTSREDAEAAKVVFALSGNKRVLEKVMNDIFVYRLLESVNSRLPLEALTETEKARFKPILIAGRNSLKSNIENHFVSYLAKRFNIDELKSLAQLYQTPTIAKSVDAVMEIDTSNREYVASELKVGRTEFSAKYRAAN